MYVYVMLLNFIFLIFIVRWIFDYITESKCLLTVHIILLLQKSLSLFLFFQIYYKRLL